MTRTRRSSTPYCDLLEARTLLSTVAAGNSRPVTPAWFAQLQTPPASDTRQGPASAASAVQTMTWNGQTIRARKNEWVVEISASMLARVPSVAAAQGLFSTAPFTVNVVEGLGLSGSLLVQTPDASPNTVLNWFRTQTSFASVEPDAILSLSTTPNDPSFSQQWALNNTGQSGGTADADIDAPEAWDLTRGSQSVVVGVLDSGIDYTHPDLAANVWTNPGEIPGDRLDNDGNGFVDDVHGYDFVNNDGDPTDDNGHGTHDAGTIAAAGNNGSGVTGVDWHTPVMALKTLDASRNGWTSDAIRAVNYATMMRTRFGIDIRVTNNSWGGGSYNQTLYDAIKASGDAGILFVASAGNGGADNIGDNNDLLPSYPASYALDNIIAVAATTQSEGLPTYSNYGATSVDLAAPGGDGSGVLVPTPTPHSWYSNRNILSTYPLSLDTQDGIRDGYTYMAGTSMAAPHVTGVAALAWSLAPTATPKQVRDAILNGVDRVPSLTGKVATGGRLNARRTLDLLIPAATGWATREGQGGASPDDGGSSVVSDKYGYVYTVGTVFATGDSGNFPGKADFLVTKTAPDGSLVWRRQFGGSGDDRAKGIALDATTGDLIVCGAFQGTVDFDPGPGRSTMTASSTYDAFVIRLDTDGQLRWSKHYGSTAGYWNQCSDVATDAQGNVYVVGDFGGELAFDDKGTVVPVYRSSGWVDPFILKLDAAGTFVWADRVGGPGNEHAAAVAVDPSGRIVVTGYFYGTVDLDPGPGVASFTTAGNSSGTYNDDVFVLTLSPSGGYAWAKTFGGDAYQSGNDVAIDVNSNIYVTGLFQSTVDFDPGPATLNVTAQWFDVFVSKFDASGNLLWSRQMGDWGDDRGAGITVSKDGRVYVCGQFMGQVNFDRPTPGNSVAVLTSAGGTDGFLLKLDTQGRFASVRRYGGPGDDDLTAAATDGNDGVEVTGAFSGIAAMDAGTGQVNLTSAGGKDLFVVRVAPVLTAYIAPVIPNPRTTPVGQASITFTQPVTGFDVADMSLKRNGGPNLLLGSALLTTVDQAVWTLGNLAGLTALPGVYTLTLNAAGSGIADAAKRPLAASPTMTWTVTAASLPRITLEAESGTGDGRRMPRGNASAQATGAIGTIVVTPGHHELVITTTATDAYDVEPDVVFLDPRTAAAGAGALSSQSVNVVAGPAILAVLPASQGPHALLDTALSELGLSGDGTNIYLGWYSTRRRASRRLQS